MGLSLGGRKYQRNPSKTIERGGGNNTNKKGSEREYLGGNRKVSQSQCPNLTNRTHQLIAKITEDS